MRGLVPLVWSRLVARGVSAAAVLFAALWIGLVVLAWVASRVSGQPVVVCMFRRVTGYPCATCGGTRAAARLAHGDVAGAIQLNPLATAIVIGVPLLLTWWVLVPPSSTPGRVHPRVQLVILLVVVGVNWAYVLWREGKLP